MKKITLKQLQLKDNVEDTNFFVAYKKLFSYNFEQLSEKDKFLLLKFAVIFLNQGEDYVEKLGYRIILRYCNCFGDYIPLYDVALNKNYIPVAKLIERKYIRNLSQDNFHSLLMYAYKETFKEGNIYLSQGQKELNVFSKKNNDFIIVAPTSYGKSEIIISKVEKNLDKKVCIIVPSKALLSQTKKRLIKNQLISKSGNRIITHPDMYRKSDESFIAVLTQERLLRLLQKNDELKFDFILVDEAHNILRKDNRAILLTQVLLIVKNRNKNVIFNYFTPFLAEPEKLKIIENKNLDYRKIEEFIKVEKYYIFNFTNNKLSLYDQFLNVFFELKDVSVENDIEFINKFKANKNIIYLNKPKNIERIALKIKNLDRSKNKDINKVKKALSEFLHEDYHLIDCLDNGIVYHHGGMPEIIRMYVEDSFSKIKDLNFIVTSSTLLEGVNIPAEKIFLLTAKKGPSKFNPSQFVNIVGRVCRFSESFNEYDGNLKMLEPEVYLVNGEYWGNINLEKFIVDSVKENKKKKEIIDNVLLKEINSKKICEEEKEQVRENLEYLENIEPGVTKLDNVKRSISDIGKSCFKNNVHDFDIYSNEDILVDNYNKKNNITKIDNVKDLIKTIVDIFIENIKFDEKYQNNNFRRLHNEAAQRFYSMFLEWRISGSSYKRMIAGFVKYWDSLLNKIIYVGKTWGEMKLKSTDRIPLYINLNSKSNVQKINLAIVRIKEEQDFIEFELMKYVEILNDLEMLDTTFYEKIKYGSNNQQIIALLKDGFSMELAKCVIKDVYNNYVNINEENIVISEKIINKMEEQDENEILIFEIKYHINSQ
jgi:superfamily II DNA or RNA helicase